MTMTEAITTQERNDACLGAFLDDLRARALNAKTVDAYRSDMEIFRRAVGMELLEVQEVDIFRVVKAWQSQHAGMATVQRRVSVLRQFYDLLYRAGLISVRPAANLRVPKPWRRVDVHAAEDLERVILAIGTQSPFDLRDRALLLLLRDSAIRANAIAQSELANVDPKLGRILLRKDKYGKDHWAPLSKRSSAALRLYVGTARPYFLRGRNLPYIFISLRGDRPLTRQRVWQIANRWTMKVLGVRCGPHAWRRTTITEGADNGMELFDLMQLAAHQSPETTRLYIRHSVGKLREAFYQSHPRAGKERAK
jgi:site-specific recombinase XerD